MHYPSDDQEEILDLPEKEEPSKSGSEYSPLAVASGIVLIVGVVAMVMELWWWRYVVMFGAVLLIIGLVQKILHSRNKGLLHILGDLGRLIMLVALIIILLERRLPRFLLYTGLAAYGLSFIVRLVASLRKSK